MQVGCSPGRGDGSFLACSNGATIGAIYFADFPKVKPAHWLEGEEKGQELVCGSGTSLSFLNQRVPAHSAIMSTQARKASWPSSRSEVRQVM